MQPQQLNLPVDSSLTPEKLQTPQDQTSFKFVPTQPVAQQVKMFSALSKQGSLRDISFLDFKGAFKIEFWQVLEEQLRDISTQENLVFSKIKLTMDHLRLIRSLITWLNKPNLKITFLYNELDDRDLYTFLFEKSQFFNENCPISELLIISNPGIFKGSVLLELKKRIDTIKQKLSNHFRLIINHKYKSVLIQKVFSAKQVKINQLVQDESQYLNDKQQELEPIMTQNFYLSLKLANCFTAPNSDSLETFLKICFNKGFLECIQKLNIYGNTFKSVSSLETIFRLLSESKGLLSLNIGKLSQVNLETIKALIGNKYSDFTLNILDLTDIEQDKMVVDCWSILCQKLLMKLKEIKIKKVLSKHIQLLDKMVFISDAFKQQIDQFEEKIKNKNIDIPRLQLERINLEEFDCYNRHDLFEPFSRNVFFSVYSSLTELQLPSFDTGRLEAFMSAMDAFEKEVIEKRNKDYRFSHYQWSVKKLNIGPQTYLLQIPAGEKFFKKILLDKTQQLPIYNIETLIFQESFKYKYIEQSLDNILKGLTISNAITSKPYYSLKEIIIKGKPNQVSDYCDTDFIKTISLYVVLNDDFHIRRFEIKNFDIYGQLSEFFPSYKQKLDEYYQKGSIHNLTHLLLDDVNEPGKRANEVLNLIINHPASGLQHFIFDDQIDTIDGEEQNQILNTTIQKILYSKLQKLEIRSVLTNETWKLIFQYLIFNDNSLLVQLTMQIFHQNFEFDFKADDSNCQVQAKLNTFIIHGNYKPLQYDNLIKNFINNPKIQLSVLQFNKIQFTNANQNSEINKLLKLSQLGIQEIEFKSCDFNQSSNLLMEGLMTSLIKQEQLIFDSCKIDADIFKFQSDENDIEFDARNLYFQKIKFKNNKISDYDFKWICNKLIKKSARTLRNITFQKIFMTALQFQSLQEALQAINEYFQMNHMETCKFHSIDLSDNMDLPLEGWNKFFRSLIEIGRDQIVEKIEELALIDVDQQEKLEKNDNNQLLIQDDLLKIEPQIQMKPSIKSLQIDGNLNSGLFYRYLLKSFVFAQGNQLESLTIQLVFPVKFCEEYNKLNAQGLINQEYNKLEKIKFTNTNFNQNLAESEFMIDVLAFQKNQIKQLQIENSQWQGYQTFFLSEYQKVLAINPTVPLTEIIQKSGNSFDRLSKEKTIQLIEFILQNATQLKNLVLDIGKYLDVSTESSQKLDQYKNDPSLQLNKTTNSFTFTISTQIQADFCCQLVNYFSQFNKIENLELNSTSSFNYDLNLLKGIKKVIFQYINYNLAFIKFIMQNRTSLEFLEISNITFPPENQEIQEFINLYEDIKFPFCELSLKTGIELNKGLFFISQFMTNSKFKFDKLTIRKSDHGMKLIENVSELPFKQLKCLILDFAQTYTNAVIANENLYYQICKQLVFNRYSVLDDLQFNSLNLQPQHLEKIELAYKEFMESLKQEDNSTLYLSLKKFQVYYSIKMTKEAQGKIFKSIQCNPYIALTKYVYQITNFFNENALEMVQLSKDWLAFQQQHQRKYKTFQYDTLVLGRNDMLNSNQVWEQLCQNLFFTDMAANLVELDFSFFGFNDRTIAIVADCFHKYVLSKGPSFIFPVKKSYFNTNSGLTIKGWEKITEGYFFHPQTRIVDMSFISCALAVPEKEDCFVNAARKLANILPGQKLVVKSFKTGSFPLRMKMKEFMNPEIYDLYSEDVDAQFGCTNTPDNGIGTKYQLINRVVYECVNLRDEKILISDQNFRLGFTHIDFFDGVIKTLNKILAKNPQLQGEINISTQVLDYLLTIFSYQVQDPEPYPYAVFFTNKAIEFYSSKECKITRINFLDNNNLINEEIISQEMVFKYWKKMKHKSCKIDQVNFNYQLDDGLFELMFSEGLNESHIIDLIRQFPPQSVQCQNGNLTVSALKALYSIQYENPFFTYSYLSYDQGKFENVGIAYSLRENIYANWEPTNQCGRFWKRFFYNFNDIFVVANSQFYMIPEIIKLNNYLQDQKLLVRIQLFITFYFFFAGVIYPYIYIFYLNNPLSVCKDDSMVSHVTYIYISFVGVSVFFESYVFNKIIEIVPREAFEKVKQNELNDFEVQRKGFVGFAQKMAGTLRTSVEQVQKSGIGQFVLKTKEIAMSQLAKYDLFTDFVFAATAYSCQFTTIAYLSFAVILINIYSILQGFFISLYRHLSSKQKNRVLSTYYINEFFELCALSDSVAVCTLFDQFAPFNCRQFPNWLYTRKYLPKLAGRSLSRSVSTHLFRFLLQSSPQIILQIAYVIKGDMTASVILSIVSSVFSLAVSFRNFMAIRPSIISQNDFDDMTKKNQLQKQELKNTFFQKEQELVKLLNSRITKIKSLPTEIEMPQVKELN